MIFILLSTLRSDTDHLRTSTHISILVGTGPIKGITRKYNAEGCKPITCGEQGWNNIHKECGIVIIIFITMVFSCCYNHHHHHYHLVSVYGGF